MTWAAVILLSILAVPSPAAAVTFRATLDPIKIWARPGQVRTHQFTLTLPADQPRTVFRARVEDWWRSEDGQQTVFVEPGSLPRACGSWVSLNPVEAAVEPGGTLTIRVTVSVPIELLSGGHWCALTVDEVLDPLAAPPGVGLRFLASVSVGIYVYIDPVHQAAQIRDVQVGAEQAALTVSNEGNAPLGVDGWFEFIRPGEQEPVAVVTIPRETLLPEPIPTGIWKVKLPDPGELPSGQYMVRVILDIGLDHYIGVERQVEVHRETLAAENLP